MRMRFSGWNLFNFQQQSKQCTFDPYIVYVVHGRRACTEQMNVVEDPFKSHTHNSINSIIMTSGHATYMYKYRRYLSHAHNVLCRGSSTPPSTQKHTLKRQTSNSRRPSPRKLQPLQGSRKKN